MAIKTFTHPDTGQTLKLGRRAPVAHGPRMWLGRYLDKAKLPTPPVSTNYRVKTGNFLHNILANDSLGDCTSAGAFHASANMLANAGSPIPYDAGDAIAFYSQSTGYVPGDPDTDCGGNEPDVLNCWVQHGLMADGSHKAAGWVAINASDVREIQVGIEFFLNAYLGINMPDSWEPQPGFGNNFVWDVAGDPDPSNGHCVVAVDYNQRGIVIDTWGYIGTMTWAAVSKYCSSSNGGAIQCVVSRDALNRITNKSPTGLIAASFLQDFDTFFGAHVST